MPGPRQTKYEWRKNWATRIFSKLHHPKRGARGVHYEDVLSYLNHLDGAKHTKTMRTHPAFKKKMMQELRLDYFHNVVEKFRRANSAGTIHKPEVQAILYQDAVLHAVVESKKRETLLNTDSFRKWLEHELKHSRKMSNRTVRLTYEYLIENFYHNQNDIVIAASLREFQSGKPITQDTWKEIDKTVKLVKKIINSEVHWGVNAEDAIEFLHKRKMAKKTFPLGHMTLRKNAIKNYERELLHDYEKKYQRYKEKDILGTKKVDAELVSDFVLTFIMNMSTGIGRDGITYQDMITNIQQHIDTMNSLRTRNPEQARQLEIYRYLRKIFPQHRMQIATLLSEF